jgi:hypothetical protein
MRVGLVHIVAVIVALGGASVAPAQAGPAPRADAFAERNRIFVLSDIGNEPDDQMSVVRLLLYANEIDIEGLAAVTSESLRDRTNPETLRTLIRAYGAARPNLLKHAQGWPDADVLQRLISSGPQGWGLKAIDSKAPSPAAQALIAAVDKPDRRPLWVSIWGGANVLAETLQIVRKTRSAAQLDTFVGKMRVYSISDQDDAGPWIRREFPTLHYVVSPSASYEDYPRATWTGISGDSFYHNDEGSADPGKISNAWLDAHIRKGPLGSLYPKAQFIMEGDTPAFLGLTANGLASAMSPAWGGWGGRYVYRRAYGETRPIWTQGGFPLYGLDSRDEVIGVDGRKIRSDQATIWRWRDAYQNDFAARIDWTIKPFVEANHPPVAVVNGTRGHAPLVLEAHPGDIIDVDASASRDPDRGQRLSFRWYLYREAGAGLVPPVDIAIAGADRARARMSVARGCKPALPGMTAPCGARAVHVILEVKDDGTPQLTSYRRIIVEVAASVH